MAKERTVRPLALYCSLIQQVFSAVYIKVREYVEKNSKVKFNKGSEIEKIVLLTN